MKKSVSVTINSETLRKLELNFPERKKSQVFEEALDYWLKEQMRNQIRRDIHKLKCFEKEILEIEEEMLEDGLGGI